jgi:hypothetical protein
MKNEIKEFTRGDVFYANIPKLDFKQLQRPSFIMEGNTCLLSSMILTIVDIT